MGDDDGGRGGAFPDGFVEPIAGLLALLFAIMAGGSAYPALSGSLSLDSVAAPITFAAASLVCLWLRAKYG
jgi:hypothetical protein